MVLLSQYPSDRFVSSSRGKRQIYVTFRGSATVRDWQVDGNMLLTLVPNPLKEEAASSFTIPQGNQIGIHSGFYMYLFGFTGKQVPKSKYDRILDDVRSELETFEGFSITICGHSLGGALATLCSFRMAFEDGIIKPITCITFASPRTGNIQFARSFQELELQQRIVCLRVANERDVITRHPDRLTICTFPCQDAIFRHVGMELLLYPNSQEHPDRTYRLRHPRIRRSRLGQLSEDFARSFMNTINHISELTCGCCIEDYFQYHSCEEYMNRLQRAVRNLEGLSMRDVYVSYHGVVGKPSAEFSLPIVGANGRDNT
jgi:Lipase (class 3)